MPAYQKGVNSKFASVPIDDVSLVAGPQETAIVGLYLKVEMSIVTIERRFSYDFVNR